MRNLRLDICYDGTRYRGWQRLPGTDNTLQGKLEQTLSRILGEPVEITGSGRTDAGVHAKLQIANFHCDSKMPCQEILSQLRRYLPEDIGIYSCSEVSPRFHARLNAREKTYRYRIWNSDEPCVFDRRFVTVLPQKLDIEKMRQAAEYFLGTHDFSAFCANKHMKKSTVRTIFRLDIAQIGNEVQITGIGLIPYYMWNSTDGLYSNVFYGANFIDYVGYVENKLTMIRPINGKFYDSYIYGQYFDLAINGAPGADDTTLAAIAAIAAIKQKDKCRYGQQD